MFETIFGSKKIHFSDEIRCWKIVFDRGIDRSYRSWSSELSWEKYLFFILLLQNHFLSAYLFYRLNLLILILQIGRKQPINHNKMIESGIPKIMGWEIDNNLKNFFRKFAYLDFTLLVKNWFQVLDLLSWIFDFHFSTWNKIKGETRERGDFPFLIFNLPTW